MIAVSGRPVRALARAGFFVLATIAATAQAAEDNYLEAAWQQLTPDQGDDSQGLRLRISAPLEPGQFLRASYARLRSDSGARSSLISAGLGLSSPLGPNSDMIFTLSYEDVDNKGSAGDKGYAAELGFSFYQQQRWQLELLGRYSDLDRAGDSLDWRAEASLRVRPLMALFAAYTQGELSNRVDAGLRFYGAQR